MGLLNQVSCRGVKSKQSKTKFRKLRFFFCIIAFQIYIHKKTLQDIYFAKFLLQPMNQHMWFLKFHI